MSRPPITGPFCQSCGRPLSAPTDYGTDARGRRLADYCHHCVRNGEFLEPWISMQTIIERTAAILTETAAMAPDEAMSFVCEIVPGLKRWQDALRGHLAVL